MVGPRQPLKGLFYTQKFFILNFCSFGRTSKNFPLANCVIVDQAVVQLNCNAQCALHT